MANKNDSRHHIKGLPIALNAMADMGFSASDCLAGTGLTEAQLENNATDIPFTLEQEFHFHRNLLALTGNPMLGLLLGKAYRIESYGLLGYAFLSASTLRHALAVMQNFGPLAFSPFEINFRVAGGRGILSMRPGLRLPEDLLTFYIDRDITAAIHGSSGSLREPIEPMQVKLMHDGQGRELIYERHFDCPVSFGNNASELHMDAAALDEPMPLRDSETSAMMQQQCRLLLSRVRGGGNIGDKVRQIILSRPGYFPDIDFVAEKLNTTSRTLRRRLARENSSYQDILAGVRYQLAREYLANSALPLEEISVLLGYSAPGNFSNAFKRWHGSSPRAYRQAANC
ncbi:AraC family transcriptional regulator [Halioglobus maricola]|uniref:AraC family transcriptional regulator n=1 Tax=Halioglobus maricola TaxID=2601894 RepID=A0A5P9NNJ7_9GAMM|nr:AraC family transcriptional regulator [Halioglobus maricola]QFU77410.1 AraC family transcriptional regulator [Halioglobus maricola]